MRWHLLALLPAAGVYGTGFLLYGWDPGDVPEYARTAGLTGLLGTASVVVGALLALVLLPRRPWTLLVSMGAMYLPFVAALASELVPATSFHNLWPIELAFWLLPVLVVHAPAGLAAAIYWNSRGGHATRGRGA